jgi:isopenicillin N synthase-like dioxygenase
MRSPDSAPRYARGVKCSPTAMPRRCLPAKLAAATAARVSGTEMSRLDTLDDAPVATAPAASLPTLDLRQADAAVAAMARGCREWGVFHLVGHGLALEALQEVRDLSRAFFARPQGEKRALSRSKANPWGYFDRELTKTRRDRKEIFDIACGDGGPGAPFEGATPWPREPARFEAVMRRYADACAELSARLLAILAQSLGVPEAALAGRFRPSHSSFLRLNYYPVRDALADELGPSDLGIHHHTDAGALTVLLQDAVSGLQVFRDGLWHDVAPLDGALTVNIGDLVQVWSNDRYPAPIHRVRAMTREDRYSAAFFYNPSYTATIAPEVAGEPAHYRPFSWKAFRAGRAEGDYADYGQEVQISDFL